MNPFVRGLIIYALGFDRIDLGQTGDKYLGANPDTNVDEAGLRHNSCAALVGGRRSAQG